MRWLLVVAALGLVGCASATMRASSGRVSVRHDRFQGTSYVVVEDMRAPARQGWHSFDVGFLGVGGLRSMTITSSSEEWMFLRCHSIDMLADGRPVPLGPSEHDGTVTRYGVIEQVSVDLSEEAATILRAAETLEGRLCTVEFDFSPAQIQIVREFIAATSES